MNETSQPDIRESIRQLALAGRDAARALHTATTEQKNAALHAIADALLAQQDPILAENAADLQAARERGTSGALLDRLALDPKRITAMAQGVREVAALPDPVGTTISEWTRPNGLHIRKLRVPIGLIAIIFESRPNVTIDASVLCLKSGNATLLRGGSEALRTNLALARIASQALEKTGLPPAAIQLIPTTDRAAIPALCGLTGLVDLLIPRGGHGLIQIVVEHARVPVIKHYDGICHLYIHNDADPDMAEALTINAKCQRPGVCNAIETLLIDRTIAPTLLPRLAAALRQQGVQLRGCPDTLQILPDALPATEDDWRTEYLDLILSIRVVADLHQALQHIETYGSHHSDAICTRNEAVARHFLAHCDSATVYWNASTRFTDGHQFGFGAEIGISTDKIHARGPMGLEELCSYKYQITGTGQTRT